MTQLEFMKKELEADVLHMPVNFITFTRHPELEKGVTQVWVVESPTVIGWVKWFGRWRKYCFFPENNTVFEEVCLRDISNFCETLTKTLTKIHRAAKKAKGA